MSGSLAKFAKSGELQLSNKEAAAALRQASGGVSTGGGGGEFEYLSFSGKRGTYTIGRDKEQPDAEMLYIVDHQHTAEGWICWKGGRPVGRHEWSIYNKEAAVAAGNLEDHGPYNSSAGDGWKKQMILTMLDEDGTQVKFGLSSASGLNTFGDLLDEVASNLETGNLEIPVLRLGVENFTAQGQTNAKPVFHVEAWVSRGEVEAMLSDDNADGFAGLVDGEYKVSVRLTDAVLGDEPEEDAPKKRRRHRAA